MSELLKIIHFLFVALGVGGGFVNLFLSYWAKDKPVDFKMALGALQGKIARTAFVSIVFLWISGIWLVHTLYGGFGDLSAVFWLKLVVVATLTVLSGGVQLATIGVLPASLIAVPARRLAISRIASVLSFGIVALAVFAFV